MSDTSGSGGFGSSGGAIRSGISRSYGGGGSARRSAAEKKSTRKKGSKGGGSTDGAGGTGGAGGAGAAENPLSTLVWTVLDDNKMLEDVLLPAELLYYVTEMARFIDTAKKSGLAGVVKAFEIRESATFPTLRRSIKVKAPGAAESKQEGSEQHSRAGGAFNSGTFGWAQALTRIDDPTQISIQALVDAIQKSDAYERALKLSARLIIEEYIERVIGAFIRVDDPWAKKATSGLRSDAHAQLDGFFAKHEPVSYWTSTRVEKTLAAFPGFVLRT
jgi:hypothetical protein